MGKALVGRLPLAGAAVQPMAHTLAEFWYRMRVRAHAEPLDDATLRDLGIGRSELPSFGAEAEGSSVELTRLRIAKPVCY